MLARLQHRDWLAKNRHFTHDLLKTTIITATAMGKDICRSCSSKLLKGWHPENRSQVSATSNACRAVEVPSSVTPKNRLGRRQMNDDLLMEAKRPQTVRSPPLFAVEHRQKSPYQLG
jgi:hypothetical protein